MTTIFEERLKSGDKWRIRCLPYFYIPGISKCGTTDLYTAINKHPDVASTSMKEPIFWNRIRLESNSPLLYIFYTLQSDLFSHEYLCDMSV